MHGGYKEIVVFSEWTTTDIGGKNLVFIKVIILFYLNFLFKYEFKVLLELVSVCFSLRSPTRELNLSATESLKRTQMPDECNQLTVLLQDYIIFNKLI